MSIQKLENDLIIVEGAKEILKNRFGKMHISLIRDMEHVIAEMRQEQALEKAKIKK